MKIGQEQTKWLPGWQDKWQDKWQQAASRIKTIRLIGRMIWRAGPFYVLILLAPMLIQGIVPAVQLFASKQIIDNITAGDGRTSVTWAWIYAISMITVVLLSSLQKWISKILAERSMLSINLMLLEAWDRVPGMKLYDQKKYRNRLEALQDSASWLPVQIITFSISFFTGLVSLVSIILLVSQLSLILAVVLVLSTLPYALKQNQYAEMDWEYDKSSAENRRRMNYAREQLLGRRAAKEIRLFGLGSFFLNQYRTKFEQLFSRFEQLQKRFVRGSVLTGLLSGGAAGLGYLWIVNQISSGSVSLGDIALYLLAIFQLSKELRGVSSDGANALELWLMGNDFRLFIEAQPDIRQPPNPAKDGFGRPMAIEFRNVMFKYEPGHAEEEDGEEDDEDEEEIDEDEDYEDEDCGCEAVEAHNADDECTDTEEEESGEGEREEREHILDGISFSIAPGECVALVGANGSGKTTIVKLLCRFYELTNGQILINGRDIRALDVGALRQRISVVFQDYGKYGLTVRENIAIADVDKQDMLQLEQAATLAQAEPFIAELPNRYDTLLGPEWGGADLSGGQWQRLAIARSMYRDADLIILDEPTASLDVRAEYELYRSFRKLAEGKSVLLISHRFSTVKMASRILVLKDGKITEEGSHKQLMELGGEYEKMYRIQAEAYQNASVQADD
ncbi:conserved membrane protein of unknown function [Paenibacillus alvei]|uniref:ABC transporter ATP-binding protein n=2 Tax=Paenibacillus alvei TaxID=44250 RepID=A0A383R7T5_PAEAL|nr:conserved membrane protein of unknown function [Paenibacillus alvei]